MVEEEFLKAIKEYSLIDKNDKILLGISGGPDSICLLHLFDSIKDKFKLKLVCVHLNHALRLESDKEEKFVKQLCLGLGIECISEKKDVTKLFTGDSLEQTARNIRYDFFGKISREKKIKKLVLAHHKDDLAETILMRLIRGSGLKGLAGFLPKTRRKNLTVIRPLIGINKKDILAWLKAGSLKYCLDKSNLEDKFLRNRIRLKLMPVLKSLNPAVLDSLYNASLTIALDYSFIYQFSYKAYQECKKRSCLSNISLDLDKVKKLPPAIFNNVIRIAIEETKGSTRRLENRHLNEIRDMIFRRPDSSIVDLPGLSVKKEGNTLIFNMY